MNYVFLRLLAAAVSVVPMDVIPRSWSWLWPRPGLGDMLVGAALSAVVMTFNQL